MSIRHDCAATQTADEHDQTVQVQQHTLADVLVEYLEQAGVEYVFGVPGGAIEPLFDALARSERRGGCRIVTARHETDAVFMAEGCQHETGRLGVCCATTGPGATNLITGAACAYAERVPLLLLSAQTPLQNFGLGALQESSGWGRCPDTVAAMAACTLASRLVSHPGQFRHALLSAMLLAMRSDQGPGPVHLSFPRDLLGAAAPSDADAAELAGLLKPARLIDPQGIDVLAQRIGAAQSLVLLVGEHCRGIAGEIATLAAHTGAVVAATPAGKCWMPSGLSRYAGVFGFAGHDEARAALTDADRILAIGCDLNEWATCCWNTRSVLNERLMLIDDSMTPLARAPMASLHLVGHLGATLQALIKKLAVAEPYRPAATQRQVQHVTRAPQSPVSPALLFERFGRDLPPETRICVDPGNSFAWSTHYLPLRQAGTCRSSFRFASMGWSIGNAIGSAIALGGKQPVVCFVGDGSMLLTGQELTVAVQRQLPVIFVILNDAALGMVRHGQKMGGAESIAWELPEIDFAGLAQAMGAKGQTLHTNAELMALDIAALCRQGPILLDVRIDRDETPPIGLRTAALHAH